MEEITHIDDAHDVAEAVRACATTGGETVSLETIRATLTALQQTLDATTPSLNAINRHTQPILVVALGIVECVGDGAAASGSSVNVQERSLLNNRLLQSGTPALPTLTALAHTMLLAHRKQVAEMCDAPSATAASGRGDGVSGGGGVGSRNPRDLFSRSSRFWLTSQLLRRTLTILHCLINAHRDDATFMHSVLRESYLLNLLFEALSLRPAASAESDEEEAESDEFIVEYSESHTASLKKARDQKRAVPAVAGVDPSSGFASSFWQSESRSSFKVGVELTHLSSVSFSPLDKITTLLHTILEATRTLCARNANTTAAAAAAADSLSLTPSTSGPQLHPFQLQEICTLLASAHGPIIFAPEMVDAAGAADTSPMSKYSAEPVTAAFPFVTTQPLPASVRAHLSQLAASLLPRDTRSFQSPVVASPVDSVTPELVYGLLLPHLKRYVSSLARVLLVLTPGFDFNRAVSEAIPDAGDDTAADDEETTCFIDLRQQILSSSSLASSAGDASAPFFLRQLREILLDSVCGTLLNLRAIIAAIPDDAQSGQCLGVRYFQQLLSECSLPLLLTKCLNQDLEKSLMRTTQGVSPSLNIVSRTRDTWLKTTDASALHACTIGAGLSTRLLRALASAATLLHLSLDGPSSQSTLLYAIPLYRAGVPQVLAKTFDKFLVSATGLAAIKSPTDVEQWKHLRERVALAYRTFEPFLLAASSAATKKTTSDKAVRDFLATLPSAKFHAAYIALLYTSELSPLCDAGSQLQTGLSAQMTLATETLLDEIGIASRTRFPYGDAAPTPPGPSTGSGMTLPNTNSNLGLNPSQPGLGLGFLFRATPAFAEILRDQFRRAQLALPPLTPVATSLERARMVAKSYPTSLDVNRLADEKQAKLDRILSLEMRAGDHLHSLKAYDLYETSLGRPVVNRTDVTLFQYLVLGDAARKWSTESWHFVHFQVETILEAPSTTHKPLPSRRARQRRAREARRERVEQRLEKYVACGAASCRARDPDSSARLNKGDAFFAHPFLPTTMTPELVELLLRPQCEETPFGALSHASAEAALLTGRVALTEAELQKGYAELIASGNFD